MPEVQLTAPNPNSPSPVDTSMRILSGALVLSILVHLLLGLFAVRKPLFFRDMLFKKPDLEVVWNSDFKEVVQTNQQEAKDASPDAKFASDRNLKTEEETSPDRSPTNFAREGGGQDAKKQAQPKAKPTVPGTLFTYSQSELLKDQTVAKETLKAGPKGPASAGFLEKLKKGSELKVNAQFFDYGSFINRMREKLAQRWNPQKTVRPEMYSQRVVQMEVAVVLSSEGEIIELYVLNGSRFSAYDEEVLRSLREAAPYPNPPKSLIQADGQVYMPWNFTLRMDSWGVVKGVE